MKNVFILIGSSGIAQAIPIAISPVLTRLYSPEEFGKFALYASIVAIFSVIATARYEQAIHLPKYRRDAMHIVILSIIVTIIISCIVLIVILMFDFEIKRLMINTGTSEFLYWIPCSIMVIGIYQTLYYWENRKASYIRIALSRTLQSSTSGLGQVSAGYMTVSAGGLIGGQLLAQAISMVYLIKTGYSEDEKILKKIKRNKIIAMAKRYKKFPQYMIFGHMLNTISGYMPLFVIGSLYGPAVAGLYSLAQRVTITPLSLIGGAIGDVYRSEASNKYRESGNCLELFKFTVIRLSIVSIILILPIYFWGAEVFNFVFGPNWSGAGDIASLLSVMIFFQCISSPTSETVLLGGLMKLDLAWQLLRLCLSVLALYVGYKISPDNPSLSIIIFSCTFAFLYVLHLYMQYKVANGSIGELK